VVLAQLPADALLPGVGVAHACLDVVAVDLDPVRRPVVVVDAVVRLVVVELVSVMVGDGAQRAARDKEQQTPQAQHCCLLLVPLPR
jgi:hypothetical protein